MERLHKKRSKTLSQIRDQEELEKFDSNLESTIAQVPGRYGDYEFGETREYLKDWAKSNKRLERDDTVDSVVFFLSLLAFSIMFITIPGEREVLSLLPFFSAMLAYAKITMWNKEWKGTQLTEEAKLIWEQLQRQGFFPSAFFNIYADKKQKQVVLKAIAKEVEKIEQDRKSNLVQVSEILNDPESPRLNVDSLDYDSSLSEVQNKN